MQGLSMSTQESLGYLLDVTKLEDLHVNGEWGSIAPPWDFREYGCTQCEKPWPCQVIRLAWALKAAQERIAELEAR